MTGPAPPRSAGELAKRVRAYANRSELAEGRVRLWVAHMALIGVLTRDVTAFGPIPITVKGGVAVELRLGTRARTTRDLDLTLHVGDANLVDSLEEALGSGFSDFTFRRSGEPHVMPNGGAVRIRVAVQYKGRSWSTVQVDLTRSEFDDVGVDYAEPIALEELGLEGPSSVPCLPLVYQIAQKLHALTEPGIAHQERVRDLVDILLLRELIEDHGPLRFACVRLFNSRGTHDWPPEAQAPERWSTEYDRLAREVNHSTVNVDEALRALAEFIRVIERSK